MSDGQEPQWEKVTEHCHHHGRIQWIELSTYTQRLPVPGGWLYLVWPETGDGPVMCFVPDPSAGEGEAK